MKLKAAALALLLLAAPAGAATIDDAQTAYDAGDFATALTGDAKLFTKFFHGCLDRGVYLAPSAYEAGFLSTAHEGPAVDRACVAAAANTVATTSAASACQIPRAGRRSSGGAVRRRSAAAA